VNQAVNTSRTILMSSERLRSSRAIVTPGGRGRERKHGVQLGAGQLPIVVGPATVARRYHDYSPLETLITLPRRPLWICTR
jgi:hypothetical protein